MRYWDASAVVATLGTQPDPAGRTALLAEGGEVMSWWATRVECASALFRLRREEAIDETVLAHAFKKMEAFFEKCLEVVPSDAVRKRAIRILRAHSLRAADALQLAAALVACHEEPGSLSFVSSDQRLTAAAEKEGFTVL